MNIIQLRYAVEVEKAGSITKAAKNLFMGQPNLSKAIRELEDEIGIQLFQRKPQGVMPTELGEQFLTYARTILSQMDELESLYRKPQGKKAVRFSVAVPRATYLSAAFADFILQLPAESALEFNYKETSSMEAATDVSNGEVQLAVIRVPAVHQDYYKSFVHNMKLRWEMLWEFRMSLLMSQDHPLASCNEIPYHMLDGYTEICHGDIQIPSVSLSQIRPDAKLSHQKRRIRIYDRGSQFQLLKQVPDAYMWVSPIPIQILAENKLVLKECPLSTMKSQDWAVYKEEHTLSSLEKNFLRCVEGYTHNIIQ